MAAVPHLGAFNAQGQFIEAEEGADPPVLPVQTPPPVEPVAPEPMATQADNEDPCAESADLYEQIQAALQYYQTLQNRCQTKKNIQEDVTLKESICTECLQPGQQFLLSERPVPSAQHPITPGSVTSPAPGTQPTLHPLTSPSPEAGRTPTRTTGTTPSTQPSFVPTPSRPPIEVPPTAPQTGFIHGLPTPPQIAIVPMMPRVPVGIQTALENLPEIFPGRRNPSGRPPGSPEMTPPPPPPLIPDVRNAPPPIQFKGTDFIAPGVIPVPNVPPITLPPLTIGGASFSTGINFGNVGIEGGFPISVTIGA